MDDNLRRSATDGERRLLELIHEVYTQLGVWPIWQHIEGEMLRRFDVDAKPILDGLPRISVNGGYGWTAVDNNNVTWPEVVPFVVDFEVAVPRLTPAIW